MTTVRFLAWRIDARPGVTREHIARTPSPDAACECEWCRNWCVTRNDVLPSELVLGLERLGLRIEDHEDLYAFAEASEGVAYRVTYWCFGTVQEGPAAWQQDPALGRVRMYHRVPGAGRVLGVPPGQRP